MELTPEQIKNIISLYGIGCKCTWFDLLGTLASINESGYKVRLTDGSLMGATIGGSDIKLICRTIEQLTDEEAIEVSHINYGIYETIPENDGSSLSKQMIEGGRKSVQGLFSSDVFQYLISLDIAVPLFIAPGHPFNGKTAIDLQLAITL